MAPKKVNEESMEEIARRIASEVWQGEAMRQSLANLIKDAVAAELRETIERNSAIIEKLQAALCDRDERINTLEKQLVKKTDELEQYQRRQCLRIFGVKEEEGEDSDVQCIEVAKKISVNLDVADIDRCHRIGKREAGKPRPIIVKFVSYRKRNELFRNKRQLKGSGITIREDLTKQRHNLLKECINKYGLPSVWTMDGVIIVKRGDTKHRITCIDDMF